MSSNLDRLHSGSVLARNSVLNVGVSVAPMVVALVAIPVLLSQLGPARFGILSLAWTVVGYFGLFDIGLGRSLTHMVSVRLGDGRSYEVPGLVWTGLSLLLAFGLIGSLGTWLISPILVQDVLRIPVGLQAESVAAFQILSVSIPLVIVSAGLKGVLEAEQRFGSIALVQLPSAVLLLVAPILVLPFSHRVDALVAAMLLVRLGGLLALGVTVFRVIPALRTRPRFVSGETRKLMSFGGWLTVSNIVSPIMVYIDRFAIGAMISLSAVASYVIPYELVIRAVRLPIAITTVFFPAFAATHQADPDRTGVLFVSACQTILLLTVAPLLLFFLFVGEGLTLWVGADLATQGTVVARWLIVGAFFNGVAQAPFALVQGLGRPKLTARFHVWELPFYMIALWILLPRFGIAGAAMAWTLRAAVDAALLLAASYKLLPSGRSGVVGTMLWSGGASLLFAAATRPASVSSKSAFALIVLPGLVALGLRQAGGLGALRRLVKRSPTREVLS